MDQCPCGSKLDYQACCGPYHLGKAKAPTAEALMRSRYSAYVKHMIPYILSTITKTEDEGIDAEATRKWSEEATWQGLEILATEKGGLADTEGVVEFVASYIQKGILEKHHEISSFVKKDGAWFYDTGKIVPTTKVRIGEKVGRNDPCTCGSGKKYKHCCGK